MEGGRVTYDIFNNKDLIKKQNAKICHYSIYRIFFLIICVRILVIVLTRIKLVTDEREYISDLEGQLVVCYLLETWD